MKNKFLSILLSFIFIFACAFSMTLFTSCGETPPPRNEEEIPGDGDQDNGNGDEDGGNEDGGDEDGGDDEPQPETPDGNLPPSGDNDWGVGEMPV